MQLSGRRPAVGKSRGAYNIARRSSVLGVWRRYLETPKPFTERDGRVAAAFKALRPRLARFVSRRMAAEEVEDVLQDVFADLVQAQRLATPIEEFTAWLFRVARNRIVDRFRKRWPEQFPEHPDEADAFNWEDTLPSPDDGPEALHARRKIIDEIARALSQLPPEQSAVFVAHEIEGRSFQEISAETGVAVNTLLSRKRYAVTALRRSLRDTYADFLAP